MSKIHNKTGLVCMICDESSKHPIDNIIFHKTRRQTHSICMDCGVEYLRPILKVKCNNIRKNIKNNDTCLIKCPGSYHSLKRNQCNYIADLKDLNIKECDISLDILRILYTSKSDNLFLCPNEQCGQMIEVDINYIRDDIVCNSCNTSMCKKCFVTPYHNGKSCIEVEMENNDTENGKYILQMKNEGKLKFCPQCRTACLKHNGCNKMICSVCDVKWCWICTKLNIDYSHYNTTDVSLCNGKLWEGVDENGNEI